MAENKTTSELLEKTYKSGYQYEKKILWLLSVRSGGHEDNCTDVVGKATRLAVKFILDHELVIR